MNIVKIQEQPDPSDVGAPWVASHGDHRARGRSREEAVHNLMNRLENKREKWTEEPE